MKKNYTVCWHEKEMAIKAVIDWLQGLRRLTVRWEYKAENYRSFLNLGGCTLLLRHFWDRECLAVTVSVSM